VGADAPAADGASGQAGGDVRKLGAGAMLYLTYCQACHGATGAGDGPAAASLRTPPTDLTRLWERYGTPLDRERLARTIDGRRLFGGHDPREMPIWGEEFFEGVPSTTPDLESAKRRLLEVLVEHLETLQSRQGA
jgi:mono/diheme cytochrome c family protein